MSSASLEDLLRVINLPSKSHGERQDTDEVARKWGAMKRHTSCRRGVLSTRDPSQKDGVAGRKQVLLK